MPDTPDNDPLVRVHQRLDDLFGELGEIRQVVTLVAKHEHSIFGDGQPGILARLAATEQGRVDTLSVKSVCTLVAAIGALAATIGAAMGALMK